LTIGETNPKTPLPRDQQQVSGGVKSRRWSRRPPQDTRIGTGARLGPIGVGLALLRPRAGAAVSGRATLSRRNRCRCGLRTLARASLLRNYGRTKPLGECPKLLRPRTCAAHSEMRGKSYTELPEEGALGEKGGKITWFL
jgi:hypothetical protein